MEEDIPVVSPQRSPQGLQCSSKTIKLQGKNYKLAKTKINDKLHDLETDPKKFHSKVLKKHVNQVSKMLTSPKNL